MAQSLLYANDIKGQYPASYYAASADTLDAQPSLKGDIKTDVVIVGAGYTGLSAALHLAQAGFDVALLDAHRVGWGASGRNGGQLGSGQRLYQDELEKMVGLSTAHKLWDLGQESKQLVRDLIKTYAINCDIKPGILMADHKQSFLAHSQHYVDHLHDEYGYGENTFLDKAAIGEQLGTNNYYGGFLDKGGAHLHPLNFALGLARACLAAGVKIYEKSEVINLVQGNKVTARTLSGAVEAKFGLLAGNGYLGQLAKKPARAIFPINNFILATEPLDPGLAKSLITHDVAVADSRYVINYYRLSADNRLLFGGGENYGHTFPRDIKSFVRQPMLKIYPQLANTKIGFGWGGTLGLTANRMPALQRLRPNIYSASGYSGHGLGMATLCGKLVAQAITGTAEKFDIMESVPTPELPIAPALRMPFVAMAMFWYALRDRF